MLAISGGDVLISLFSRMREYHLLLQKNTTLGILQANFLIWLSIFMA